MRHGVQDHPLLTSAPMEHAQRIAGDTGVVSRTV
jgi:hypothetical protein